MTFPDISPFVFGLEYNGFGIRWYALAYIAGLLLAWRLAMVLTGRPNLWPAKTPPYQPIQAESLLFMLTMGVIIGGRLGFVLFYNWDYYSQNPMAILKTWEGGMAFHGGLLGVVVGGLIFCWLNNAPILSTADSIAVGVPFGILFGRLANFINAELWGKPGDVPWAMQFPTINPETGLRDWSNLTEPRHPSQLYEAGLEGLLLMIVLLVLAFRGGLKRPGLIAGVFLFGYGLARAVVEIWRDPNPGLDCVTPLCLQMGQVLSLPMIAAGLILILWALSRPSPPPAPSTG